MQASLSYSQKKDGFFSKLMVGVSAIVAKAATTGLGSVASAHDAEVTDQTRELAYAFAVISLASRFVRVQGDISKPRYHAFRSAFPIEASEDDKIRQLFELASKEALGEDHYVRRIMRLYPGKPRLYRDTVERLIQIASADAGISLAEYNYLRHLAHQFGLSAREWKHLAGSHAKLAQRDPYAILGVRRFANKEAVKNRYMRLIKEYHPDRLQAEGASPETLEMATLRMAEINAAYDELLRIRG